MLHRVALFLLAVSADGESLSHDLSRQYIKMFLLLGGLVALMVMTLWYVKRYTRQRLFQGNRGYHMKVVERRPLSAKTSLYLIEVDGKGMVIADSPQGVTSIAEVGSITSLSEEVEQAPAEKSAFLSMLQTKVARNKS